MRILVLDADHRRAPELSRDLRARGALVDRLEDVGDAACMIADYPIDVAVAVIPDGAAHHEKIIRQLRHAGQKTALLAILPEDDAAHRIQAMIAGADSCLSQPCGRQEVVERVLSLYRRSLGHASNRIQIGPITVDIEDWSLQIDNVAVRLKPRARKIFGLLALRSGYRFTREDLHERVNGPDSEADPKVIDVYICHIRKLLREEFPGVAIRIETFPCTGWVLKTDMPEAVAAYLPSRMGRSRRHRDDESLAKAA